MEYTIKWCDVTEYETTVEASSKEQARELFLSGEHGAIEPTGWCEMESDSLEIEQL